MNMLTPITIADDLRDIPNLSMKHAVMFSKTAITVESAAKLMNRKNNAPQIFPLGIWLNMFGNVTKIKPGPAPGFMPYAKHAGKMINPAVNATNVSSPVTIKLSPKSDLSLPI